VMNREIIVLQEIKHSFGWPIDAFRYGIPSEQRYIYDSSSANVLPVAIQERVRFSLRKAKIAQRLLNFLTYLPWVQMVFLTGSVAALNAKKDDDIDVWIIVDPKRIWLTRALDFFVYIFLGKRRLSFDGVESDRVKDKLCFNFYSTIEAYELQEQTISNAIQFVDALPMYIRDVAEYRSFLAANAWVKQIFPSWYQQVSNWFKEGDAVNSKWAKFILFEWILDATDYVAGVLMLLKAEKRLCVLPSQVYRKIFTTWGTPRILSKYDQETFSKSSQEGKQRI